MIEALIGLALVMALVAWLLLGRKRTPVRPKPEPSTPVPVEPELIPAEPVPGPEPETPAPEPTTETPERPPRPDYSTEHTYQRPGDYLATLTLFDAAGRAYVAARLVRIR